MYYTIASLVIKQWKMEVFFQHIFHYLNRGYSYMVKMALKFSYIEWYGVEL